jgi:hypothetical protein
VWLAVDFGILAGNTRRNWAKPTRGCDPRHRVWQAGMRLVQECQVGGSFRSETGVLLSTLNALNGAKWSPAAARLCLPRCWLVLLQVEGAPVWQWHAARVPGGSCSFGPCSVSWLSGNQEGKQMRSEALARGMDGWNPETINGPFRKSLIPCLEHSDGRCKVV